MEENTSVCSLNVNLHKQTLDNGLNNYPQKNKCYFVHYFCFVFQWKCLKICQYFH